MARPGGFEPPTHSLEGQRLSLYWPLTATFSPTKHLTVLMFYLSNRHIRRYSALGGVAPVWRTSRHTHDTRGER